jgi:pheromone shutdown-related protein TraB
MKRDYARLEIIERNEQTIYLLGTAHVSQQSVEEVKALIEEVEPQAIAVELCPTRYEALTAADKWKNLDIFKVIREGKLLMLLGNLALSAYQRRIGKELGVEPGAELVAGVDAAKERGLEPVLIDRDIQTTLKRTWGNVGFWKKLMLLSDTLAGVFESGSDEVNAESVEALKNKENLDDAMGEFAKALPEVKGPLIDERDLYMVSKLQELDAPKVVAVVGAGHVAGMTEHFEAQINREELTQIPPPSKWTSVLKWLVPAIVLLAFGYGIQKSEGGSLEEMLLAWILPNSIAAALMATIAGAKPLTVLVAGVGSPITSLNPLLGVGMVAGLLEAWLRKPTVADCDLIHDDVQSLSGFYRNRFLRVILVTLGASMGSAMGAWVGAAWLVKIVQGS